LARYHGRKGRLYLATSGTGTAVPVASLSSWSLDYSTDKEEVTAFGDANKTYVQGLPDVSVEFSGFWDDTDTTLKTAALSSDGTKVYLYPSTDAATKYAYGPAWADFSIEVAVDGAVTVSGTIAANGSWGINL
jgi:hypothetical protein